MGKIDDIIDRHLSNVLFEAKINVQKDPVVSDAQKRMTGYMKDLVKNGDERVISLMKNKGYANDVDKKDVLKKREEIFNDFNVSDDLSKEILDVVKILSQFVNDKGGVKTEEIKKVYPDKYWYLMRMKNLIDLKGLTYLYDKSANKPNYSFGIKWNNGGDENDLDFNKITDTEARKYRKDKIMTLGETRFQIKQSLVSQYLDFKYGLHLDVPNIDFSNGNAKLPDNTLIINFTSALNCPAWNECLVKHACYARIGEKRNPNVFRGNENRSLYWLTTEHDEKLMSLMMDFARSYCFDYTKVAKHLIENNMAKGNVKTLSIKISKLPLNDSFFTPEIIEVMKQYKRIDYIRLNENGDFIGQWLVDAWDKEAGLYQPYGVNVSAYTCRHLNYEGIKNIILNTSFQNGKGNIARRFIALPTNVYTALDETYGGKNNELIFDANNIQPNPQPLYSVSENMTTISPNGKLYYKCPCGRKSGNNKISCYQCNLCYQPKNDDNELIVFVCAHGSAQKHLQGYDLIKNNIGVSKNFFYNYKDKKSKQSIKEDTQKIFNNLKVAENEGIKNVTNNAIKSTYNHFKELKTSVNESENVIKLTESEFISTIKEVVYKYIK